MNTMLQGIKASDNKIATQIKDLQSIFKDKNQVGLGNKDQANMTKGFKELEIKHDLALENMKVYQKEGFDEMKGLLHLISKTFEKFGKDQETASSNTPKKDPKTPSSDLTAVLTRLGQIKQSNGVLSEDMKKRHQDQTKLIKAVSAKLNEMEKAFYSNNSSSKKASSKNVQIESDQWKGLKDGFINLEQKMVSSFAENSNKVLEELTKLKIDNEAYSEFYREILNSVDDLKQLTSSTPNTVHDLVPQIDKIATDIARIPDDIGNYTAGLEENLCANLEGKIKEIHLGSLNVIERRLAVIKKYVKYGKNTASIENADSGSFDQENAISNRVGNEDLPEVTTTLYPTNNVEKLVKPIAKECKAMFDESFSTFRDGMIGTIDEKIQEHLNKLLKVDEQILHEQAKALVIEEQFEALANTILQPIAELKDSNTGRNTSGSTSLQKVEDQLRNNHQESLECLNDIKNIWGVATKYGPSIAENQQAIELISKLVKHLIHVQRMQDELIKQGDKSIEYQANTNQIYETLVPSLEEIRRFFDEGENPNSEFAEIPELTSQLLNKINSLNDLESRLLTSPRLSKCEDLSLIHI